ncbi:hypothetical protein EJB05_42050, partial [Eragrostis curvula]
MSGSRRIFFGFKSLWTIHSLEFLCRSISPASKDNPSMSLAERDERDEADEHVDLLLRGAEPVGHAGADEQAAEIATVLARRDERVASPQSALELLERPPCSLPPHNLGELQLTQQAADELHVLRQPPARAPVAPRRQRGLHDHGHKPQRVHADQLRHARGLSQGAPQAARAVPQARHGRAARCSLSCAGLLDAIVGHLYICDGARDERDEADEHVDLLLRGAELVGHPGADEQAAEVAAVLARRGERVAPPQRAPELLERAPRGLPPHELRELQLSQQAADDLHVLRQPPARVAVSARRQRGLHDHGHQPERVHAHQLRHVRRLPERAPQAARAVPQARHGPVRRLRTLQLGDWQLFLPAFGSKHMV